MAPKTNTNPTKLASILSYFHTSGQAHSIKDLEKALPSVASINSMQVKDYLQALSDESQIRVEKIGSGNWYWSFPGEEKRVKTQQLKKATEERDKANGLVDDLKTKVARAEETVAKEEGDGQAKREAIARKAELEGEVAMLKNELEGFRENDPVEMERKKNEVLDLKARVDGLTDQILEMERYLKDAMAMDKEALMGLKMEIYGEEYGEEEEGLKEF